MVNGTWYYGHFRGEGVVEVNVQGRWLQAYDKNDEDSDFDPSDPNQVEVDGITCFSCFKRLNAPFCPATPAFLALPPPDPPTELKKLQVKLYCCLKQKHIRY